MLCRFFFLPLLFEKFCLEQYCNKIVITASVVTYNHCLKDIEPVLKSLTSSPVSHIFVIDHSDKYRSLETELKEFQMRINKTQAENPTKASVEFQFSTFYLQYSTQIHYVKHVNNGYGGGHNVALKMAKETGTKYHLVVNPDVWFDKNVIPSMMDYMDENPDVGHMMPKVLFPDGSIQPLVRLLPSPVDMVGRLFMLISYMKRNEQFELHDSNYDMILNAPFLSGCFMFLRMETLDRVGMFDDRFFMYAEDIDLTRRIHARYKTVFFPRVEIFHKFTRGSSKNLRLFFIHTFSIIKYFNKWGWLKDDLRDKYNKEVLDDIQRQLKTK